LPQGRVRDLRRLGGGRSAGQQAGEAKRCESAP